MSTLRFQQVTLQGIERPRLENLDFRLDAGECAFLLGPNGAGKSSVLRTVLGLEQPSSGRVEIAGIETRDLHPRARAEHVAWLPQQASFEQGLLAREVVAIARYRFRESRPRAEARAEAWLAEVGAGDLAERSVTELSGGEQQRVKLAALLAQEAPVLLLDEPANHLDPAQQVEVYRVLARQWQRGASVLCVTHDVNLVGVLGQPARVRLLGLREGRLSFDTHFSDAGLARQLEGLYGWPFREVSSGGPGASTRDPRTAERLLVPVYSGSDQKAGAG